MSEDEIIKAGISALRTGDKTRAKSLFSQLVKENPSVRAGLVFIG